MHLPRQARRFAAIAHLLCVLYERLRVPAFHHARAKILHAQVLPELAHAQQNGRKRAKKALVQVLFVVELDFVVFVQQPIAQHWIQRGLNGFLAEFAQRVEAPVQPRARKAVAHLANQPLRHVPRALAAQLPDTAQQIAHACLAQTAHRGIGQGFAVAVALPHGVPERASAADHAHGHSACARSDQVADGHRRDVSTQVRGQVVCHAAQVPVANAPARFVEVFADCAQSVFRRAHGHGCIRLRELPQGAHAFQETAG